MKMSKPLYHRLQRACWDVLREHGLALSDVKTERHRWEVFHAQQGVGYTEFYDAEDLNDNHIDTALRRIFQHTR